VDGQDVRRDLIISNIVLRGSRSRKLTLYPLFLTHFASQSCDITGAGGSLIHQHRDIPLRSRQGKRADPVSSKSVSPLSVYYQSRVEGKYSGANGYSLLISIGGASLPEISSLQ
jgi:hypothetical protein